MAGTDSALSISTTRVGIGTASPEATLNVFSASAGTWAPYTGADEFIIEHNGNGGMTIAVPDANNAIIALSNPSRTTAYSAVVQGLYNGGTDQLMLGTYNHSTTMTLQVGNVGIGETAPESAVEISKTAPYLTLHNTSHEDTNTGRESRIIFKGEKSGGEETTLGRIETSHVGTADDWKSQIRFSTNQNGGADTVVTCMTLDESGYVGIGTNNIDPSSVLHVLQGNVLHTAIFENTHTDGCQIQLKNDSDEGYIIMDGLSGSGKLSLGMVGTVHAGNLNIDSTGNVGIGTTAPSYNLHVVGGDGAAAQIGLWADRGDDGALEKWNLSVVENSGDPYFSINGGSTTAHVLACKAGKVGINAVDPGLRDQSGWATDLEVRGTTGSAFSGAGVLTLSTAETSIAVATKDVLGIINFQAPSEDSGTDAQLPAAAIWCETSADFTSSVNAGELIFATAASETAIAYANERI